MSPELTLTPKQKSPNGQPCCEPVVYPDVDRARGNGWRRSRRRWGPDPVDPGRRPSQARRQVCVCELVPLFDVNQSTLSHHLKKLRDAGIVDSERQGLWSTTTSTRGTRGTERMAEAEKTTDCCSPEDQTLLRTRSQERLLRRGAGVRRCRRCQKEPIRNCGRLSVSDMPPRAGTQVPGTHPAAATMP